MTYGVYLSHVIIIAIVFGTFQSGLILTDYIYAILCMFAVMTSFAWSSVLGFCHFEVTDIKSCISPLQIDWSRRPSKLMCKLYSNMHVSYLINVICYTIIYSKLFRSY